MKQTEVVKIDSRGRIVIPRTMRRSLGLKEDAKIMMIYEDEKSEIRILPLPITENQHIAKFSIRIRDEPGALAKIATLFGDLGISLLYGQTIVVNKGKEAEWSVIGPLPDKPIEELKKQIIDVGGAISVEIERPFGKSEN